MLISSVGPGTSSVAFVPGPFLILRAGLGLSLRSGLTVQGPTRWAVPDVTYLGSVWTNVNILPSGAMNRS
jgi:hypothetical protein